MNQVVNLSNDILVELREAWDQLKQEQPHLRIRNAAEQLNVSELELLLTHDASQVLRLEPSMGDIMRSVPTLGEVMTLVRNDQVVHETKGTMQKFSVSGQGKMGLCLGEIDLRVFFHHWVHAYAVSEPQSSSPDRHSIQFFSASGEALFKIYETGNTDRTGWKMLIDKFLAKTQRPPVSLVPRDPVARKDVTHVDWQGLEKGWSELKDVHEFHGLLKTFDVDRRSALDHIGKRWAQRLPVNRLEDLLNSCAERKIPIMVFVGNFGIVQIFTGVIQKLFRTGPWFNVLDSRFNLHANTEGVESAWVVVRPSDDGDITSLECFNHKGELVLTVFGERKPGKPELSSWRECIAEVERL